MVTAARVCAVLVAARAVGALPTPRAAVEYRMVQLSKVTLGVAVAGPPDAEEALLLLHGYPECSWFWRGLVDPLLAAHPSLRLYMPDQRGFNTSSKPKGIGEYNVSHLVGDVVDLVGHIRADRADRADAPGRRVHVLGHDWGGPVAWLTAGWHPGLVQSLSILNGPHPSVFIDLLRHDPAQQKKSAYMLAFDTPEASLADPADFFDGDGWFDPVTKEAYERAYKVEGARDATLNWYRANVFAGREYVLHFSADMPSTLPANLTVAPPTLVLWGTADTAFDTEANLGGLPRLVKDLTVKRYPGVGHWIAQDRPAQVAADVAAFIGAHSAPQ